MSIKNNTTSLQDLLEAVNALPNAGTVELPTLTNEGSASDLLSGKQLIDQEGNVVTGTFSIDSELSTQDDLIAQIQAAVDGLPDSGGSGGTGGSASYDTCTLQIDNQSGYEYILAYTSVENGEIIGKYSTLTNSTSIVCLCQSILCVCAYGNFMSQSTVQIGYANSIYFYRVDGLANETITAYISGGGTGN